MCREARDFGKGLGQVTFLERAREISYIRNLFTQIRLTLTKMKRKSPDTSSEAALIIKPPSINMASSLQKLSMDAILSTESQVDASSLLKLADFDLVQLVLALKESIKKAEERNKKNGRGVGQCHLGAGRYQTK